MKFLRFGSSVDVEVELCTNDDREFVKVFDEKQEVTLLPLYYDGETVSGKVIINIKNGRKLEHQGIRIEFLGIIVCRQERGNDLEFINLPQDLARPGILTGSCTFPFEFLNVEKPYESYDGTIAKLRYFIRVTLVKRLSNIVKQVGVAVHALSLYTEHNSAITMEVGIEDCLHIELEYNSARYHLKDIIFGKIYFSLVRVKITSMEMHILRREICGTEINCSTDDTVVCKFELMDGSPVRGECIPMRCFLGNCCLTPTMIDIRRKFSVRYFLNLVLTDEEERRYYKQQEIILYRKAELRRSPFASASLVQSMKQDMESNVAVSAAAVRRLENSKAEATNSLVNHHVSNLEASNSPEYNAHRDETTTTDANTNNGTIISGAVKADNAAE